MSAGLIAEAVKSASVLYCSRTDAAESVLTQTLAERGLTAPTSGPCEISADEASHGSAPKITANTDTTRCRRALAQMRFSLMIDLPARESVSNGGFSGWHFRRVTVKPKPRREYVTAMRLRCRNGETTEGQVTGRTTTKTL